MASCPPVVAATGRRSVGGRPFSAAVVRLARSGASAHRICADALRDGLAAGRGGHHGCGESRFATRAWNTRRHAPARINPLLGSGEQQVTAPTLDGLHVHRLTLLFPDMYPRLLRVMEAHPVYQDRIVNAVSALMLNARDHPGRGRGRRGSPTRSGESGRPVVHPWSQARRTGPSTMPKFPKFNVHVAMATSGVPARHRPQRHYRGSAQLPGTLAGRALRLNISAGWSSAAAPVARYVLCRHGFGASQEIRELIEDALSSVEDDLRAA